MPFGVASALSIFQRTKMDNLLQGFEHVVVYIDDILITGCTEEEHLCTLVQDKVLQEKAGMHLKKDIYVFMVPSVKYLGHRISKEGLASSPGASQILSHSRGEKSEEGLGSKLRHKPEMGTRLVQSESILRTDRVHHFRSMM